jgi:DNA-binding NarL/FixJ family response regulator
MNAEKELLLALLIEKYTAPKTQKTVESVKANPRKRKRDYTKSHKWSLGEKVVLATLYKEGKSWREIADRLNLRPSQCRSMYSNLPMSYKAVK